MANTLSTISSDSLFEVLKYLTPEDARSVRAVSRRMLREASENKLWKVYCSRKWPSSNPILLKLNASEWELGHRIRQPNYLIKYHFEKLEDSVDWALERYRFLAFQALGFAFSRIPALEGARHSSALKAIFAEGLCSSLLTLPFTIHLSYEGRWLIPLAHGGIGAASAMIHRYFEVVPDVNAAFPTMAVFAASYIFTERVMHLTNLRVPFARQCSVFIALYPYFTGPLNACTTLLAAHSAFYIPQNYQLPYVLGIAFTLSYFQPQLLPFVASFVSAIRIVDCIVGSSEPQFFFSRLFHTHAYPRWKFLAAILPSVRGEALEWGFCLGKKIREIAKRILLSPPVIETRWNLWRGCIQLRGRVVRAVREDIPNAIRSIPVAILVS